MLLRILVWFGDLLVMFGLGVGIEVAYGALGYPRETEKLVGFYGAYFLMVVQIFVWNMMTNLFRTADNILKYLGIPFIDS